MIEAVVEYLMKCAVAAYVETNEKFGFVGTHSKQNIHIAVPKNLRDVPQVFSVNIIQIGLIRRPASFPVWNEKQMEVNAKRLAQLKVMFESAVQGDKQLVVSYYAENYDTATVHYQISRYKG